jgi:DNA-binding NtrC family response regulator
MKKRLLVVDDDSAVRESLKKVLEDSGYDVVLASGADEAERLLAEQEVGLLLLDLNMPKRDGWDVLERVRSDYPLLRVILMTALSDQLDTTEIPGVSALLKKPIEVSVMLKSMEDAMAETEEDRLRRAGDASGPAAPGSLKYVSDFRIASGLRGRPSSV